MATTDENPNITGEPKTKYGTILKYDLPDREAWAVIWAAPPKGGSYKDNPFLESLKLTLPTELEKESSHLARDARYLWVGVLPATWADWRTAADVSTLKKRKEAEERNVSETGTRIEG